MTAIRGEGKPERDWLIWLVLLALAVLFVWWLGAAGEASVFEDGDVAAVVG